MREGRPTDRDGRRSCRSATTNQFGVDGVDGGHDSRVGEMTVRRRSKSRRLMMLTANQAFQSGIAVHGRRVAMASTCGATYRRFRNRDEVCN